MLVVGEYVVRFALDDITSTSNMQTWFGSRWKKEFVVKNSLGYREREVTMPKPEGVYRIVMLGDSFGYGQGIPVETRFSNILERELNAAQPDASASTFEVLNFSSPGSTTKDQIQLLQEVVLPLEPDFVLVQWLPNDFEDQTARWQTQLKPLMPNDKLHRKWQRTSALYFLLNNQWQNLKPVFGVEQLSYAQKLMLPFSEPGSDEYTQAAQPMIDFLAALQASGAGFALVLHPMLHPNLASDYLMLPLHELVQGMCVSAGATCLDLSPPFTARGADFDMTSLWVNRFDPHPGAEANRMVADFILDGLAPDAWGYTSK